MFSGLEIGKKVQITHDGVIDRYNLPEDNVGTVVEQRGHWNAKEIKVEDKDGNFKRVKCIEEHVKRL